MGVHVLASALRHTKFRGLGCRVRGSRFRVGNCGFLGFGPSNEGVESNREIIAHDVLLELRRPVLALNREVDLPSIQPSRGRGGDKGVRSLKMSFHLWELFITCLASQKNI